jgi:hypothetical protein
MVLYGFHREPALPSHIGAAAKHVLTGEVAPLALLLLRKAEMFARLWTATVWPSVLLILIALFRYAVYHASWEAASWRKRYAGLWAPLRGLVGGAVVGMVTNDSGMVVAAMMFWFALVPAVLFWLEDDERTMEEFAREFAEG